jgi:hypothetical protein
LEDECKEEAERRRDSPWNRETEHQKAKRGKDKYSMKVRVFEKAAVKKH